MAKFLQGQIVDRISQRIDQANANDSSEDAEAELTHATNDKVLSQLERITEYNFNIFELSDASNGHPLLVLSNRILIESGLASRLKINERTLLKFLFSIEQRYDAKLPCKCICLIICQTTTQLTLLMYFTAYIT